VVWDAGNAGPESREGKEPADHRWIGEQPIGHALAGKRGRIC
jgi:hypothetical protein